MAYIKSTGFLKPGYTSGLVNFDKPIIRPYSPILGVQEVSEFGDKNTFSFNVNIPPFTPSGSGHGAEFKLRVTYDAAFTNGASSIVIKFWKYDLVSGLIDDLATPVFTFEDPATAGTGLFPQDEVTNGTPAGVAAVANFKESAALHGGPYIYSIVDAPSGANATLPFGISIVHP